MTLILVHSRFCQIPTIPSRTEQNSGTTKIKVNPTQVSEQMSYPVEESLVGGFSEIQTAAAAGENEVGHMN